MELAHTLALVKSGPSQNSGTPYLPVLRNGAIYWSELGFSILFSAKIAALSDP